MNHPALRYHGGKFRLASWVMQFFPPHDIYVECFGGAAGVLIQKPRSRQDVYNDLDGDITNFFAVVKDRALRQELIELLELTPWSQDEWRKAYEPAHSPADQALKTIIRAEMGFGSAGATKSTNGFRSDTKRKPTLMSVWHRMPARIAALGERLQGLLIHNDDALKVMRMHDTPATLHYADPPYVMSTRVSSKSGQTYYRHELTDEQHAQLLQGLQELQGMVVLSGYPNEIYAQQLKGWQMHTTQARIAAHRGAGVRTEAAWLNPACVAALQGAQGLFAEAA